MPPDEERLRSHPHRLTTLRLVLRPMTESDWAVLLRWNQDPNVLRYWDAGSVEPWTLEKLQAVYRRISTRAFMFMIVHEGRPVGECWLQQLNLPDVQQRLRGRDARRIDLSIGEPGLWGRGLGTEAIGALVELGFQDAGTDAIVACHVAEDNPRSRRAFEKNGFVELGPADAAGGSRPSHHLVLTREKWMERS